MSGLFNLVVYTRDRHPPDHCSFLEQGGSWPAHCVEGTDGFRLYDELPVLPGSLIIDKGTDPNREAYSGFDGTDLTTALRERNIHRCVVAGLATDYCVKATVLDAIQAGFQSSVMTDAIGAADVSPGDGDRSLLEMRAAGALLSMTGPITTMLRYYRHPTALLIVDMQNDFFPGGALPVPDAPRVFGAMQQLLHIARMDDFSRNAR